MGAPKAPTDRRRSDSQFRSLVEHTMVGMAMVQDERFIYVNAKYCEVFGYSRDELLRRVTPLDLVTDADRTLVASYMEKLLAGAQPSVESVYRGKRRDGSTIDVEVLAAVIAIGGRPALIASIMDVSDRKRMEGLLRERELQVTRERDTAQGYLDIAGVMILVLDADAKVVLINRLGCSILGYDNPKDILGKSWNDHFIPQRMRDEMREAFRRQYSKKDPGIVYYENPVITKTGEERIIAWRNSQFKDERGHVTATLSSGEDITERRRLDESLRLSEARFRSLFEEAPDAIVVHDLNQGRFTDANRKAEELFECGRQELLRLGPQHFYSPEQPDGRPVEESFSEHSRRALAGEEINFERRIRSAKGTDRICEVRLVSLASMDRRLVLQLCFRAAPIMRFAGFGVVTPSPY
ncbi:MAG: PAS domain S-box protein [Alphaproteobacteria bacterium]